MNNQLSKTEQSDIIGKRTALQAEVMECEPLIRHLKQFAEKGAVYLPSAGNFGDGLIGLGTVCLFEKIGINPDIHDILDDPGVPRAKYVIVGGGGGWLDGLWNHYAKILEGFLEQGGQALILPSTVKGFETFFQKYAKQITIFARERVSYDHLLSITGMQDRVFLCHDLAFATDFSLFQIHGAEHRQGRLNLFREDEEAENTDHYTRNYDLSLLWNSLSWFDKQTCVRRLAPLIALMSQFEQIHTDRLHMSILGTLMGCQVTMHPSGYFKNSAVYEYSLSGFPNVTFTSRKPDDSDDPVAVSRIRDGQDIEALADLSERNRMLDEELQATRDRNLNYAYRLDDLARQLEESARAHAESMPSAAQQAYLASRGYRFWVRYNEFYEDERMGPALRKLRSVAGNLLRKAGLLK